MKPGEGRSTWKAWLVALLLTGCATNRASVEKHLMADRAGARNDGVSEQYVVGCPDVLEVQIPQRPELSGQFAVQVDGRIDLGDYGRPRVEGQPLTDIARLLAAETGSEPEEVKVRVADFRSQHLVLFGQVIGWQRTVPYEGQETVLELLQRVGGITPGAEPGDVYVVRPHLGERQRPEVFHVDLQAIVMRHDEQTNLRLLPYDQIHVGETRQARMERLLPPWLRSVYQELWGTRPRPTDMRRDPERSRWVSGPHVGTAEVEEAPARAE